MKHRLPPLDGLKVFEAAARHLSFSIAADELCITKGAVSYQIHKLEENLQCTLFRRSIRQVYLTDSGQMLLHTTQQLFDELNDTLLRLQDHTEQSGITVAVTTYVAARWLSVHVSAFNDAHPHVAVLLQHSVNSADFKLTDVDLAIRWGPCVGRQARNRFGEMPMPLYPVISPKLLHRHGLPTGPLPASSIKEGGLATLPLLGEDRAQDLWQEWFDSATTRNAVAPKKESRNASDSLRLPAQAGTPATVRRSKQSTGHGTDYGTGQKPVQAPSQTESPGTAKLGTSRPSPRNSTLTNPRRIIADSNVRVQAAIDGQGFILADQLMVNELRSAQLIAPFAETLDGYGYALLCSPNRILSDNAQVLKNWLAARAST